MITQKILNRKLPFVGLVTFLVVLHLIWDYFHNGIPTHYLLAREDLPGISNWWGLLTIPVSSYILIHIANRQYKKRTLKNIATITNGFIAGLIFGITISLLWELKQVHILRYTICLPFLISFFKPVHLPGNLLGFILGATYTFGGILPIFIGLVLLTLSFLIWVIFRRVIPLLFNSIFKSKQIS